MARAPMGPAVPMMPPTGIAPVTDQVDTTGQDALSPTTQVLNYLKARGYTPSTENVRRALEANQRDPGVIGGLRSDTAATEADDQAAMAAARGKGGSSSGGGGVTNPPMVDLGHGPTNEADWKPPGGATTSAAPPDGSSGGGWLTALLGSGGALASAILNRVNGPTLSINPNPGAVVPAQPGVPVPPAALPPPAAALPPPAPQLPPPGPVAGTPPPGTGPTDMEQAMQRATAPAGPIAMPPPSGVAQPGMANVDVPFNSPSPRVPPAQPLSLRPGGGGVNFVPRPKVRVPAPTLRIP